MRYFCLIRMARYIQMLSCVALLIIFLSGYAASLNCRDFAFGNINGTDESNFKNTTCEHSEQFCVTFNGSLSLPNYHFDGIVGQCDGAGETAATLKNTFGFTCWREGCEMLPLFSLTRCCCGPDLCNTLENIKNIRGLNAAPGNVGVVLSIILFISVVKMIM